MLADVDTLHQRLDVVDIHPVHDQLVFTVRYAGKLRALQRPEVTDGELGQGHAGVLNRRIARPHASTTRPAGTDRQLQDQVIREIVGLDRKIGKHLRPQHLARVAAQIKYILKRPTPFGLSLSQSQFEHALLIDKAIRSTAISQARRQCNLCLAGLAVTFNEPARGVAQRRKSPLKQRTVWQLRVTQTPYVIKHDLQQQAALLGKHVTFQLIAVPCHGFEALVLGKLVT
ncbi:hypothetical protein D3C79_680980 [compost metagenome]